MVKVVIVVSPEPDEDTAVEVSQTPYVYTSEFQTLDDVLDWFGEAGRFSDLSKVPHRLHPIGEGC